MKLRNLIPYYAEVVALRAHNQALLQALTEPELVGYDLTHNGATLEMTGTPMKFLAGMFTGMLDKGRVVNYAEAHITSPTHGPLVCTVQKRIGKTPHEMRVEAEAALVKANSQAEDFERRFYLAGDKMDEFTDRLSFALTESRLVPVENQADYLRARIREVLP